MARRCPGPHGPASAPLMSVRVGVEGAGGHPRGGGSNATTGVLRGQGSAPPFLSFLPSEQDPFLTLLQPFTLSLCEAKTEDSNGN